MALSNGVKDLIQQGDSLFSKRMPLLSLWQEQADQFYPERADFTASRTIGEDFAGHLSTSYPLIVRRDMGNTISSMLRPRGQDWFKIGISHDDDLDGAGKQWLEAKSKVQRRVMYDKSSQFVRSTKQGDHDFVTFGQCVLSVELNRLRNGLLYRNWHLRDVVWSENDEGFVDNIHRKWTPTAKQLKGYESGSFKLHGKVLEALTKEPYKEFACRHIVVPADVYAGIEGGEQFSTEYVGIYIDIENEHIMEATGLNHPFYIIPRWQTVSGSQYAFSPCTVCALPDARLLQSITLTLLEAGEKASNPPMIAQTDVIKSNVDVFAGGLTWVDQGYDERLGDALRPIPQDFSGIPMGMDIRNDVRHTIMEAFYLNKLNLPPPQGDMTATEVSQRVEEYIRNALPLFEPMEEDYNAQLCERSFDLIMETGGFGSPDDMPDSLGGKDIEFSFESPLHQATERQKGHTFMEAKAMLAEAVAIDPSSANMIDVRVALRDTLDGIRVPAEWVRDDVEVDKLATQQAQEQAQVSQVAQMQEAAKAAKDLGSASKDFAEGQAPIV